MAKFRLVARAHALVLAFALLMPFLLNLALTPALAAEQQLNAAITASLCAESSNHQSDDQGMPSDHHGQCCILCVSQGHVLAASNASQIIEAALQRQQQPEQQAALQIILRGAPDLEWASPRGPPTTLPV